MKHLISVFLYEKRHFINRYRFWIAFAGYGFLNLITEPRMFVHFSFLILSLYFIKYLRKK